MTPLGPDANERVLFERERVLVRTGLGATDRLLFPRGLMLDFDAHRADRRVLAVAFKPEPMRHYATALDAGIARAVAGWGDRPLRFYDAIKALTFDLAADSFLHMPLGAGGEPHQPGIRGRGAGLDRGAG